MSNPSQKSRERAIAIVAVVFAGLALITSVTSFLAPTPQHVVPSTPQGFTPLPPPR